MACLFGHKWNGCKCVRCGETRDEQHDYHLCMGRCIRCGKTQVEQHDWNGCKCKRCGKVRDEQHSWVSAGFGDGVCLCTVCRKEIPHDHDSKHCVCRRCGAVLHIWKHCKCEICGEQSGGENRCDWHPIEKCREQCSVCGKIRKSYNHQWHSIENCQEQCIDCGEIRNTRHQWEHFDNCKEKCAVCGKVQIKSGGNHYKNHPAFPLHEWKKIPGKCQERCKICGSINNSLDVHTWVSMPGCRKKCSTCGALAYDHNYAQTWSAVGDSDFPTEYKCTKCGHAGSEGGRANVDTLESGLITQN